VSLVTFHKYPETVALHRRPEILAVKEVIATEKLHGTNFRVYFPENMTSLDDVRFGGRNEVFNADDKQFYSGRPVRWFTSRPELLQKLWNLIAERGYSSVILYGEICGSGIQKGVRYVPNNDGETIFRAFDIMIGDNFVSHDLFAEICDTCDVPRAPVVWRGEPSLEAFDALLEKPSVEGERNGVEAENNLAEGVVIRSNPLLRTVFGDWLIIKHKSSKFEEVHKARKEPRPDEFLTEEFARTYVTAGRVLNVLGHLRETGADLQDDMSDMPQLVRALVADLHKEAEPEWQDLVAKGFADKQISGAVTKVLSGVYRRMLLESVAA
jgi:Rnl2 family RNA ligase